MPVIREVKTIPLSVPYDDDPPTMFRDSWGVQLYVRVVLGDVVGWGEVLTYGSGVVDSYIGVFDDVITPAVIGAEVNSVDDIAGLVDRLEKLLFTGGLCGVITGAIGGFEMALWDALGRHVNRSVSELLGARSRDSIPVYASFPRYGRVDYVVKAVDRALGRGFTMVKLHEHTNDSLEAIKAVRESFGYDLRVALDINAAFNDPNKALEFLNKVHRYEPYWVEEPTWPPNDYDKLGTVSRRSPVPIAAGENEYYMGGFKGLVGAGVSYVQPDISKVGGILRFMDVIKDIKAMGRPVAPHHRPHKSILTHTYTLHIASIIDGVEVVEWPLTWVGDIYDREVRVRNGEVRLSDLGGVGVGLNINEDALSKYPYTKRYVPLIFH
ncbi:Mandelate racemase/muconate lactonizing protein [Vulcanisaeta moutnovskia 768-28]|uniref:Mandelate racemase/muconate lactonizing protein n=1 Tax=Vulcanisaeta moutnovskia (strain 768-28) TaxID=985053 RepID=F0QYB8_VULM7|nr:mandelate racemase/muconate lactonizing enzyme family protein [Vulcanisaeta moutnovskia]ADY01355.1 Mandelate racemase/muconate lactonizing protein [Vulcanisaeta moutnovskia 768-28]